MTVYNRLKWSIRILIYCKGFAELYIFIVLFTAPIVMTPVIARCRRDETAARRHPRARLRHGTPEEHEIILK
jgi:hypothetical protein